MSRTGRRTKIGGQFAPRLLEMLRSPAMGALSLSGRRALDRLEIELGDHGGRDNGRLPCTFDDFQRFGIDRDAIAPALREVIALGFVERTEEGVAGNAEFRRPNVFRLTYRPTDFAEPTDDWKGIKTDREAKLIAKTARQAKSEHAVRHAMTRKKSNPSRGKPTVSARETPTENAKSIVRETPTTVPVGKTPTTLDISGRGEDSGRSGDASTRRRRTP